MDFLQYSWQQKTQNRGGRAGQMADAGTAVFEPPVTWVVFAIHQVWKRGLGGAGSDRFALGLARCKGLRGSNAHL